MIAATSLTRIFDRTVALSDITLTIETGEMFALIGPHAAGKTTFFRIISGLLHPTSGRLTMSHRAIGVVPQRFSLDPGLSIDANLAQRVKLHDIDLATAGARIRDLLAPTGLARCGTSLVASLPAGMKQKLALVAALLTKPDLLLLDDPTAGLDPLARCDFWHTLQQLRYDGLTIVVATPNIKDADHATRLGFLQQGRLIDIGTHAEILPHYQRPMLDVPPGERSGSGLQRALTEAVAC